MKREIRSSAIAGMAGVGAVIDVGQESFLIPGIEHWRQQQLRLITLKRLSDRLHKTLKAPREEHPSLMIRRFPRAMFCEKCRRMLKWKTDMEREDCQPLCPANGCGGILVPMRFVVACENGHLDDVDWWRWAHSGPNRQPGCKSYNQLSFTVDTSRETAGLGSLKVECRCGSWRSLEDISNKAIVKEVFQNCNGCHPWVNQRDDCQAELVVLQRGATNLHYPSTISALDIPLEAVESSAVQFADQIRSHPRYQKLVELIKSTTGDTEEYIEMCAENIAGAVGCSFPDVLEVARAEAEGRIIVGEVSDSSLSDVSQDDLLDEEWRTIEQVLAQGELSGPYFNAIEEELAPTASSWMKALVRGVILIPRLREVRSYLGFQRVKPSTSDKTVPPDIGVTQNWLPASEIFGEGIVLILDYDRLEKWATQLPDEEKGALILLEEKRLEENFWFLSQVHPIFLALHTLSHLLLRRITFECGYSSSSLRERLYFNSEKRYVGLMIYTADGDSEGSLGGLVRQGRQDRLAQSIYEAIDQGRWCSADPVCSETPGQGLGGFNHAACHACCLVAETSCTSANTLLDRRMLFDDSWGLLRFLENLA